MLFTSFVYLLAFLPVVLLGWYGLHKADKHKLALVFLILASLVFYAWFKPSNLLLLLSALLINYLFSFLMAKKKHPKLLLSIGVIMDLAVVVFLRGTPGVSFYFLSLIAFLVDRYRDEITHPDFLTYSAFVTYFPKLLSGPIVLPEELMREFRKSTQVFDKERFYRGFCLFTLGFGKKILLADNLGNVVNWGFSHIMSLDTPAALTVIVGYNLELLMDFTGYCDMAIGTSEMLGISLPDNFTSPFRSKNMKEMWRRWHITLGRFFTKYVYFPLGGSKKGLARTLINTMIVFLVSAFWHGDTWTFLVWGVMHGLAVSFDALLGNKGLTGFWGRVRHALTLIYWVISFTFFRADTVSDAILIWKRVFSFSFEHYIRNVLAMQLTFPEGFLLVKVVEKLTSLNSHYVYVIYLFAILAVTATISGLRDARARLKTRKLGVSYALFIAAIFVWSFISMSGVTTFLYFKF